MNNHGLLSFPQRWKKTLCVLQYQKRKGSPQVCLCDIIMISQIYYHDFKRLSIRRKKKEGRPKMLDNRSAFCYDDYTIKQNMIPFSPVGKRAARGQYGWSRQVLACGGMYAARK